jgi:DNA-directed RNA polymerase subunit F
MYKIKGGFIMNQGQEKFLGFILERVQEDKVEEARELLADNFKKQAEGTFTQEDAVKFMPKMISLLKPEKVSEVQEVMKQFAQNMKH